MFFAPARLRARESPLPATALARPTGVQLPSDPELGSAFATFFAAGVRSAWESLLLWKSHSDDNDCVATGGPEDPAPDVVDRPATAATTSEGIVDESCAVREDCRSEDADVIAASRAELTADNLCE